MKIKVKKKLSNMEQSSEILTKFWILYQTLPKDAERSIQEIIRDYKHLIDENPHDFYPSEATELFVMDGLLHFAAADLISLSL